ncbi:MAG: RNase adapter RapZ [Oligoflexales bacterium]
MAENNAKSRSLLVIVTSVSGAGKTTVINALEDTGFRCMDSMPVELLDAGSRYILGEARHIRRFAIGLDLRTASQVEQFLNIKNKLSEKLRVDVVFLTCEEENIIHRYSTTRRKHPFIDECGQLLSAIRKEKDILRPIKEVADVVYNTTAWSPHFLARTIESRFEKEVVGRNLHVTVTSFGFKYGILKPADEIFDVRFLKNPYFDLKLKNFTGLDPAVQDFIHSDERTELFIQRLVKLHEFLLPNYYGEGKHYFRIGIGCTGGKHRSVLVAEALAERLAKLNLEHILVSVSHRDVNVENYTVLQP